MKELICKLLGHKYYVYAKPKESWATGIRWLKCKRCNRDFGINCRVRALVPLDYELMDLHAWEILSEPKPKQTRPADKA